MICFLFQRLFNSYILVQSEFLRRLALCLCADLWTELTQTTLLSFLKNHLPDVLKCCSQQYQSLCHEQKLFRAIRESKDKQSLLKPSAPSNWDFSDIYMPIRSAAVHFQSLLMQVQHLQDILESENCAHSKERKDLLSRISQILIDISREVSSGQACIDRSLVQALKMLNSQEPTAKLCEPKLGPSSDEDMEKCSDSLCIQPIEDEVFELIISQEEMGPCSDEDEWDEVSKYSLKAKREGEASKRVLQELKTVLVKKADEWREREKQAMAMKGITYTAPEQVTSIVKEQKKFEADVALIKDEDLGFLPTNCPNDWPLPRLKGSLKTHRSQRGQSRNMTSAPLKHGPPLQQSDLRRARDDEQRNSAQEMGFPRVGFGASVLVEAMAKSKAMQSARKEDVFLCSEDEFSSGE